MGSSHPSKLYDPIRQQWVAATPEERVRQQVIITLVHELGYPPALIGAERELKHLPHLAHASMSVPSRRIDLVVFGKDVHPRHALYPLLLIECKQTNLSRAALNQVLGYNYYVGAPVVAVVNAKRILCTRCDAHQMIDHLPTFAELAHVRCEVRAPHVPLP